VPCDAAQALDDVEEPRLPTDGQVEARIAVGDDVERRHLLLADETGHGVQVLLAKARVAERILEFAATQLLGEPLGAGIRAGDRRGKHEITGGVEHAPTVSAGPPGVKRFSGRAARASCSSTRSSPG